MTRRKKIISFGTASWLLGTVFVLIGSASPASALTVTGGDCSGDTVTATWAPQSMPGLTGYEVEVFSYSVGFPERASDVVVGPTQTSAQVTLGGQGYNSIQVSTITSTSETQFDSTGID